jgi:hypothetical protein
MPQRDGDADAPRGVVTEGPAEPLQLPVAREPTGSSAQKTICCSPIWHGIIVCTLALVPLIMVSAEISEIYKNSFGKNAYWYNNAATVLQGVLAAPSMAISGNLSQPHRFGRKWVLLFLSFSLVAYQAIVCTQHAYVIVTCYVLLGLFGGVYGTLNVLTAWCTDWCDPELKVKGFAVLQGCMFGAVSLGPMLAVAIKKGAGDHYVPTLFGTALVISLCLPLYLFCIFPRRQLTQELESDATPSLRRRFSMDPSPRLQADSGSTVDTMKPFRDMRNTCRQLFRDHCLVVLVFIIVNFVDTALTSNAILFLNEERHLSQEKLNALISCLGVFGFVVQCIGVPFASDCGMSQYTMLFISVLATVAHLAVYAGVSDGNTIVLLEPLGSFAYVIGIAATAIVSGVPSLGGEPAKDQGTLVGVFSAFKALATCVSPILLAACTTQWREFPPPFNVAGIGFWILTALTCPAIPLAALAMCRNRSRKGRNTADEDADNEAG